MQVSESWLSFCAGPRVAKYGFLETSDVRVASSKVLKLRFLLFHVLDFLQLPCVLARLGLLRLRFLLVLSGDRDVEEVCRSVAAAKLVLIAIQQHGSRQPPV